MDKVALITGASGGIGRAVAALAGREGYAVALACHSNPKKAQAAAKSIEEGGGQAAAFEADLSRESDIAALFDRVHGHFGHLDALVNNAGIIGWEGRVDEASADRLNHLWAVNLTSYFLCCREAIRRMSTLHGGTGGAIVNVSSLSGAPR